MTRRPLLVFGLAFLALTLPLAWAWFAWGSELYTRLLLDLLDAVGVRMSRRGEGNPASEIDRQYVDAAKIRERCGWSPQVSLAEGIERTIAWYRDHPEARP